MYPAGQRECHYAVVSPLGSTEIPVNTLEPSLRMFLDERAPAGSFARSRCTHAHSPDLPTISRMYALLLLDYSSVPENVVKEMLRRPCVKTCRMTSDEPRSTGTRVVTHLRHDGLHALANSGL